MPTYEYACTSCKHEWEFEQSMKDAPLTECPTCHEQTARRQISRGTGFILKGGGWYSDLYASTSNKPTATAPEKSESSDKGDKGGSSDSSSSSSSSSSDTSKGSASSTPA